MSNEVNSYLIGAFYVSGTNIEFTKKGKRNSVSQRDHSPMGEECQRANNYLQTRYIKDTLEIINKGKGSQESLRLERKPGIRN